jgi:hypothetical protein
VNFLIMPLYYFDIRKDQRTITDREGVSLPSPEAAEQEAIRVLNDVARGAFRAQTARQIAIDVRDPNGPVAEASLQWRVKRKRGS